MSKNGKVVSFEEAVACVQDYSTVFVAGIENIMLPDRTLQALENRFLTTGHPQHLREFHTTIHGMGEGVGLERFAHEGMVDCVIGSGFSFLKTSKMTAMLRKNKIKAYVMPMGTIFEMLHSLSAGDKYTLVQTGIGTFVDCDVEGGQMNQVSKDFLCKKVELNGDQYLCYENIPVDVAIIRGTTVDEDGNLTVEREPVNAGVLSAAMAAKACGGKVIVQAQRLARRGTLHPRDVLVPGIMVDYIVIDEEQQVSGGKEANPCLTGEIKIPVSSIPKLPLDIKKVISRRAAMEIGEDDRVVNLGVGIPANIPPIQVETCGAIKSTFFPEHGSIGGIPAERKIFGVNRNPEAILDSSFVFPYYRGGGLDIAFLGFGQIDRHGNVNVSKFNGIVPGCGGFIDIAHKTKRLVFCGTFSAVGADIQVKDGKLNILREGKERKVVEHVEQITLNGNIALKKGQKLTYVTERCVFQYTDRGMTLVEIAPGVDMQKDILDLLPFSVDTSDVKLMPESLFTE